MSHAMHKVTSFAIVGPHRLAVTFDDGLTRTIDFRPVLKGEMYADGFAEMAERWTKDEANGAG